MSDQVTVLVVDDNALLRYGLTGSIEVERGLKAVGEASCSEEALELYRKLKPDVVTMDYRMPGDDGAECTRKLLTEFPDAKVILFSVFETQEDIWNAVQAGVKGYLTKNAGAVEDVMEAIHEVANGGTFFPARITRKIDSRKQQLEISPREMEVLKLLGDGMSNKEISEAVGISLHTVKHHIGNIREKLDAADRTQAVIEAYKRGILHFD